MGEMDDMTQATFTTLEGKEVSLADYKGKKVLFEVLGFMVPNLSIWTSGHYTTF